MKYQLVILLASISLIQAKIYSVCELSLELYLRHKINKMEIPYHICIAAERSDFNTRHSHGQEYLGLFKIGSDFWCGRGFAGGYCKVKCSYLENDDISDDVKCATMILHSRGITAFGLINNICDKYHEEVTHCFEKNLQRSSKNHETHEIIV